MLYRKRGVDDRQHSPPRRLRTVASSAATHLVDGTAATREATPCLTQPAFGEANALSACAWRWRARAVAPSNSLGTTQWWRRYEVRGRRSIVGGSLLRRRPKVLRAPLNGTPQALDLVPTSNGSVVRAGHAQSVGVPLPARYSAVRGRCGHVAPLLDARSIRGRVVLARHASDLMERTRRVVRSLAWGRHPAGQHIP